jgi:AdoMet-dependent heme synthase
MDQHYAGELTTEQCRALLDNIATLAKPIIILTGGEPMLRDDIYEIAAYGHALGMRMVMAPCGTLVNADTVARMRAAGIECISLSLDGATAAGHDGFRDTPGAFDAVIAAATAARAGGLAFQINTTICRDNLGELEAIMQLANSLGAVTFNPFLLVPTGRGVQMSGHELTPEQYEQTLTWLAEKKGTDPFNLNLRVTCGPQYQRIIRQMENGAKKGTDPFSHGSGCMGGKSFAFISHTGSVQICGGMYK